MHSGPGRESFSKPTPKGRLRDAHNPNDWMVKEHLKQLNFSHRPDQLNDTGSGYFMAQNGSLIYVSGHDPAAPIYVSGHDSAAPEERTGKHSFWDLDDQGDFAQEDDISDVGEDGEDVGELFFASIGICNLLFSAYRDSTPRCGDGRNLNDGVRTDGKVKRYEPDFGLVLQRELDKLYRA